MSEDPGVNVMAIQLAGQTNVRDDTAKVSLPKQIDAFLAGAGNHRLIAVLLQSSAQERLHRGFIFNEQQGKIAGCGVGYTR